MYKTVRQQFFRPKNLAIKNFIVEQTMNWLSYNKFIKPIPHKQKISIQLLFIVSVTVSTLGECIGIFYTVNPLWRMWIVWSEVIGEET